MIGNYKIKDLFNILLSAILFFSILFCILYLYKSSLLVEVVLKLKSNGINVYNLLGGYKPKEIIAYILLLDLVLILVLLSINKDAYASADVKFLSKYLFNQDQHNKFVSYCLTDAWGSIISATPFFTQLFKIPSGNIKLNLLDVFKNSTDILISEKVLNKIALDLKKYISGYQDIQLKLASLNNAIRISYVKINNTYIWQTMLVSINQDDDSWDSFNKLSIPICNINANGDIIYKNIAFDSLFSIIHIDDYNIKNFVEDYLLTNNYDNNINSYNCSNCYGDALHCNIYQYVSNNKYKTLLFLPQASIFSNDEVLVYEDYLGEIYHNAPFGIIILDENNKITKYNKAIANIFDVNDNETSLSIIDLLGKNNAYLEKYFNQINDGVDNNQEIEIEVAIGSINRLFKLVVFAGLDNSKIIYLTDITHNKYLETQVKLSQGLQTVGQIASVVAHDFNNLLTAIMSFTYFLQERQAEDDPSRVELEQIKQNANRAKIMIKQLLTFSRKQELKPVSFDVNSEISDLMSTVLRLVGDRIQANFKRGRDVGKILMDKVQFHQVMTNLVVNAKDSMKKGGKVDIITSAIRLNNGIEGILGTIVAGDYVLIEIKDEGEGIKPENLKVIFQPHFSTKGDKGNGLGLSTVNKIISDNAGFVDIKSKLNVGTSLYLYLPKTDKEENDNVVEINPIMQDLTGEEVVLLVDDELPVRMVCSRLLKSKGYKVIEAENGDNALEIIKKEKIKHIDLVVSDVMMPGLSGPELIAQLRDIFHNIKAILISGYSEDILEDINGDVSLKGIEFLAKPFTPDVFATKVKSVLVNKKQHRG